MKQRIILAFQVVIGVAIAWLGPIIVLHRFPSEVTIHRSDGTMVTVSWFWDQTVGTAVNLLQLIVLLGLIIAILNAVSWFQSSNYRPVHLTVLILSLIIIGIGLYTASLPYPANLFNPTGGNLDVIYKYPDAEVSGAIEATFVVVALAFMSAALSLWALLRRIKNPTQP